MTSLVAPADVRGLVNTGLTDANLQDVIERVEARITSRIGEPQTDALETTVTKTFRGEGYYLFLPTEIHAVVSITEDESALTSDQYQVWSGGVIERLPSDSYWGSRMTVVYKPVDDRLVRKQAIIDMVRITLEQTAMKSESVAGEYSFTAPANWEAEFSKVMKRLLFKAV